MISQSFYLTNSHYLYMADGVLVNLLLVLQKVSTKIQSVNFLTSFLRNPMRDNMAFSDHRKSRQIWSVSVMRS